MNIKNKKPKPVVLIILDGWGVSQDYAGNAISRAHTTAIDNLISKYPTMTLRASGDAVGLPWGESGNSEVGHLNLGLGRVLYQDLPRINKHISDKTFGNNQTLRKAIEHVKKNNSQLHLLGLASNGDVHSSIDHLYALLSLAKQVGLNRVFIHIILDGRDVAFNSGKNFIRKIEDFCHNHGIGKIATISGRFYAMDRNNNWERTKLTYEVMTKSTGRKYNSALKAVELSYKNKIYDEEFLPCVITQDKKPIAVVENNDSLIFFNFRPDRARQITKAFVLSDFDKFMRSKKIANLFFVSMTEYEKGLPVQVAFAPLKNKHTLGEVISQAGLKQLRIAETEKYAHVTYFFNGGQETSSPGEDHVLIPSKPVASYDQVPEMSATEITAKVLEAVADNIYDFILINFANADMVGHTGNIDSAIKAVEVIDKSVDKIVNSVLAKDGVIMITADHGNAEIMFNMQTGQIDKEHTANPVPFILVGNDFVGQNIGWLDTVSDDLSTAQPQGILADVAPTVLDLLRLNKPSEMTGITLINKK